MNIFVFMERNPLNIFSAAVEMHNSLSILFFRCVSNQTCHCAFNFCDSVFDILKYQAYFMSRTDAAFLFYGAKSCKFLYVKDIFVVDFIDHFNQIILELFHHIINL
ncbi:unnamed protein product [Dicrocoelium dendriticum]|nr:unnamed protein product [Dicrocoelium dendriticum]